MQSYQYFIDDIQSAVYSPETADPDFLRDAAAQYAEACAEANDRLRQVGKLLHRGLRGEALQLAEEEPHLLDLVAMLDFSELPAWRDLLRQWSMAAPPTLLIDLASEINQAYADQQPVESLLKQHRLLALARAPLAARIHTLRHIRRADGANGAWEDDLKALENARLKQMDRDAESFCRRDDLDALAAIKAELDADGWLLEKPKAVVQNVSRLHKHLSEKLARIQLTQLVQKLNAAHMNFDVEVGLRTRELWNKAATVALLRPDEALAEQAAPALDWLSDEERRFAEHKKRSQALRALEEAIDSSASKTELIRLYEAALVFDEPLPQALRHRAEQRIEAYSLAAKRKHRVILTLIIGSVLLAGGLITYVIVQQANRANVAGIAAAMASMVDEGRLAEARQFYEKTAAASAAMVASPEIQTQLTRLNRAEHDEQARRSRFESAVARASDTLNRPDLEDARKLARTSDEKQQVDAIERDIVVAQGKIQQQHNESIGQRLGNFRARLAKIEASQNVGDHAVLSLLATLSQEISQTSSEFPNANRAVIAQLEPLKKRLRAIQNAIDSRRQQAAGKERITQAVGNSGAYVAALKAYGESHPTSSIGVNLNSLIDEASLWDGLLSWDAFLSSAFSRPQFVSAQEAREMLTTGEQLETRFEEIPLADFLRSRKTYLQSVASREPPNESPIVDELKKLFRDPLVGNLWMVQLKDGLRYYTRRQPVIAGGSIRFQYIAGFDLTEKPASMPETQVEYVGRAPQSQLADECLQHLERLRSRGWEASFRLILDATAGSERLEPILKAALLQRTLKVAANGSSVLREAFDQYRQELDAGNVDLSVSWMEPRDQTAIRERVRAEVLLSSLPPIAEAIRIAASKYQELRPPPDYQHYWVGWLSRDTDGGWQVATKQPISRAGELVIIKKVPGQTTAEIELVGDVENGTPRIGDSVSPHLVEGRPVFQRVPKARE